MLIGENEIFKDLQNRILGSIKKYIRLRPIDMGVVSVIRSLVKVFAHNYDLLVHLQYYVKGISFYL